MYLATNLYNNNSNTVKHFGETLIAPIYIIIACVNVQCNETYLINKKLAAKSWYKHDHKWRHRLGNGAYFSFVIKFHNFSREVLIKYEIPGFEMQVARKINDYVTIQLWGRMTDWRLEQTSLIDRILLFPLYQKISRNLNDD